MLVDLFKALQFGNELKDPAKWKWGAINITALGGIKEVANTPAATILSSGYAMIRVAKEVGKSAGDTTNTGGDVNTITGDENTSTVERNQVTATTAGAESAATATP